MPPFGWFSSSCIGVKLSEGGYSGVWALAAFSDMALSSFPLSATVRLHSLSFIRESASRDLCHAGCSSPPSLLVADMFWGQRGQSGMCLYDSAGSLELSGRLQAVWVISGNVTFCWPTSLGFAPTAVPPVGHPSAPAQVHKP